MSVDKKHSFYEKTIKIWKKSRDVICGEEAVKKERELYLPGLGSNLDPDYEEIYKGYLTRAMFYPASGRTLRGISGALFRTKPKIDVSSRLDYLNTRCDKDNNPIELFLRKIVEEQLITGRFGVLVEMKPDNETIFVSYPAESITNWRVISKDNKKNVIEQIILFELREKISPDGFGSEFEETYLELGLDENNHYFQQRWIQTHASKGKASWVKEGDKVYPLSRGEKLKNIPFVCFGLNSLSLDTEDLSPLLPLVNVNLSHYRSSADIEHARHFTALPTPYVTGVPESKFKSNKFRIGSPQLWRFDNKDAKVGMLEFTGAGLQYLEEAMKDKENLMISLGARLLEPQKAGVETAEALRLRQGAEVSILSSLADMVCIGMEKLFEYAGRWIGLDDAGIKKQTCQINKDFFDNKLSSQDLLALVQSWQAGAISREVLTYNMRQGELLPESLTDEEIMQSAQKESEDAVMDFNEE